MNGPDFPTVLARLAAWRAEALEALSDPASPAADVPLKLEIEEAIGRLEWCSKYGVRRESQASVLPAAIAEAPPSEYRIIEVAGNADCVFQAEGPPAAPRSTEL